VFVRSGVPQTSCYQKSFGAEKPVVVGWYGDAPAVPCLLSPLHNSRDLPSGAQIKYKML
jgi:hypothetical protein